MRFLIAGYGSIGRRHFRNLLALGERDIVLYRTGRSTLAAAPGSPQPDELQGFPVETSLEAALAHKPDAVIVANPTALHLETTRAALEAGCHVLLEKPIAHMLDEAVDQVAGLAAARGLHILVGFQFRFHPLLQQARQMLAEGAIGQPVSARVHWGEYLPGWHPWEDYRSSYSARKDLGGGVVLTLSHPLDYLRMLLGEVGEVWAFTGHTLGLDVEDTAEIGLRFAGTGQSLLAGVHLDYIQRPPKHDLEIIGTEGTLYWDALDNYLHVFRADSNEIEAHPAPDGFERNHLFIAQMQHFIDLVKDPLDLTPVCTFQDGVQALKIARAALESAETGRRISILG